MKNVTLSDVENSLYYIHLETPQELVAPMGRRQALEPLSPRSSMESARSTIPRKPLPSAAVTVPDLAREKAQVQADPHPLSRPQKQDENVPPLPPKHQPNPRTLPPPSQICDVEPAYRPSHVFADARTAAHPLPPLPLEPHDLAPPLPPPYQVSAPGSPITRKPVHAAATAAAGPSPTDADALASPPRSPRPARPPASGSSSTSTAVMHVPRSPVPPPSPTRQLARRPSASPFFLTIIRRDPTSGHQWNVGRVSSFATNIPTPECAAPDLDPENMPAALQPRAPHIDVHIETSGYAKYRGLPTRQSVGAGVQQQQQPPRPGSSSCEAGVGAVEEGFHRRVEMAYTRSWAANLKDVFRRQGGHVRSQSGTATQTALLLGSDDETHLRPPPPGGHSRSASIGSTGSTASRGSEGTTTNTGDPLTEPGPGRKAKGYMFRSPWDGVCKFRTGNGGCSLRLRHVLDSAADTLGARVATAARAAGRARGLSVASAAATAATEPREVSELRFNLPSGDLFKSGKKEGVGAGGAGGRDKLSAQFDRLLRGRAGESSGEEGAEGAEDRGDEEGLVDLSGLGREKAGGGNRGNRAKLGKLVIHDEGLKMLDLVVAANVGVWWTVWERMV